MGTPVRRDDAIYKTVAQISAETNINRKKVVKLAEEAEAAVRIGRMIRINATKLYSYLDNKCKRRL